jgi:hypothetical protein
MTGAQTKIGIILLNWNNWQDTLQCLELINKLDARLFVCQVIVVDNGSTDDSKIHLASQEGIRIIENQANLGFAAGNNPGIVALLEAGCDFILLINNDTRFSPSLLADLLAVFDQDSTCGIACPKIIDMEADPTIHYAGGYCKWPRLIGGMIGMGEKDLGQYDEAREVDFGVGTCMLIRREVFTKAGLLDEDFFFYHEDVDYSLRAKRAGFSTWYQPQAVVYHRKAGSTANDIPLRVFLEAEARVIFFRKHIRGSRAVAVIIFEILRLGRRIVQNALPGIRLYPKQYLRGILSGLRTPIKNRPGSSPGHLTQ